MPMLDMPLDELKVYQGCTPRPADFDEYWSHALSDLDAVAPGWELVPDADFSAPGVECLHLSFNSVGGVRVHCKLSCPTGASSRQDHALPAVLFFHGYQCDGGEWTTQFPYSMSGFCYVAMDVRGQTGLTPDLSVIDHGPTFGGLVIRGLGLDDPQRLLYRHVFLDTVQLVRVMSSLPFVDGSRLGTMGFSQGGGLALACAALSGGIKRVVSGLPFLCDYKRSWDLDVRTHAYDELHWYFRYNDPLHRTEARVWNRLGYIDIQNLVERIVCPVTMFTALQDDTCLPSTQFAAYNKIRSEKRLLIYPEGKHEILSGSSDITYQEMLKL